MKIQLVTINTWKCDGDYYKRRQVLADQLKKLTPHIIACQECFLSLDETIDTLRFLAEELDMYYHFTPARLKPRLLGNDNIMGYSGLGVLSVFRLSLFNEFDLPGSEADIDRKAQQVLIEITERKKLLLTNIHLTHLNNASRLRKSQLSLVAKKVLAVNYDYNIICGDFNTEPGSDAIKFFKNESGAADCYELGSGLEPRVSLNGEQAKCVDYIFALPLPQLNTYPTFIKSEIVLNTPDDEGIFPSDHFGISTTLITV